MVAESKDGVQEKLDFARPLDFSVPENYLTGPVVSSMFTDNCSLQNLDLLKNGFIIGWVSGEIWKCRNLVIFNLSGANTS